MPVLIIPGFFRRKRFYLPLYRRLRAAGLEVEIVDLGWNVRRLSYAADIVRDRLAKTTGKADIIAHSFGGLIIKSIIAAAPGTRDRINSLSFVAVPHRGSWAALLALVWPAALDLLPFAPELKNSAKAILPAKTANFLPAWEHKIWPKNSSRLNGYPNIVIPRTGHDSIILSEDFAQDVAELIKTYR